MWQLGWAASRCQPLPARPWRRGCYTAAGVPARRTCGARHQPDTQARASAAAEPISGAAPAAAGTRSTPLRPLKPQPARLDAAGLVPSTSALEAVPPSLRPLLPAAVAAYEQQLGPDRLVGVYLRGSLVQQGSFVLGLSDADFLALYEPPITYGDSDNAAMAEGLQAAAELLQRQFPQCVKVELKAVPLPPGASRRALDAAAAEASSSDGGHLPPSAVQRLLPPGLDFVLRTQAVCVTGPNLPSLLAPTAALPPLALLPALVGDVSSALQHAQQAQQRDAAAPSALRWALKRCVRAAFELCLCSSGGRGEGAPWTRDLYWCRHFAAQQYPQLGEPLTEALELYLALAPAAGEEAAGAAGPSTNEDGAQPAEQLLQRAGGLAERLAARIDGLFLQAMLSEEPGWLTLHRPGSESGVNSDTRPQPSQPGHNAQQGGGSSRRSLSSWQRWRVQQWAAGGGADRGELVGCPPPPVLAAVEGSVLSLDWRDPATRQQAVEAIAAAAALERGAVPPEGAQPGAAHIAHAAHTAWPPQPLLLKGAAADWAAVRRWSLAHFVEAGLEGRVRVAPSLQFPFTEPRLAAILAAERGPAALPSCVVNMGAAEFAARLQRGNPCGLDPIVYGGRGTGPAAAAAGAAWNPASWLLGGRGRGGDRDESELGEYYYLQAELPPQLLAETGLDSQPPFVLPSQPGPGQAAAALRRSQAPRVWVSAQGAISPTHYDAGHSFLCQIAGRKRMLFWSPDDLAHLYFYPDTHLLRRRSRVNVHAPDAARYPLFSRAVAREALLEPGDVVFFPSRWAHYTESLDFSISATTRFD